MLFTENRKQNLVYLTSSLLTKVGLKHGFFLRWGGQSSAPFDTLNLGDQVGDDPTSVSANRSQLASFLEVDQIVFPKQTHSKDLHFVENTDPIVADGLITQKTDLGIGVVTADCQGAIFYDPKKKILATVHAGWRGLVQNIYQETIDQFVQMGSDPQNILVAIGPSLGLEYAEFVDATIFPDHFSQFEEYDSHYDLKKVANWQLEKGGINKDNIEISTVCSYASSDCFSYRRDSITGRMGTVAVL